MTLIEFIGFIITMVAFFFLIFKQARDQRRQREQLEVEEEEMETAESGIKEVLDSLDQLTKREEQPLKAPSLPPPVISDNRIIKPELKKKEREKSAYAAKTVHDTLKRNQIPYGKKRAALSRGKRILKGVKTLKEAIILSEIIGFPKSRHDDF